MSAICAWVIDWRRAMLTGDRLRALQTSSASASTEHAPGSKSNSAYRKTPCLVALFGPTSKQRPGPAQTPLSHAGRDRLEDALDCEASGPARGWDLNGGTGGVVQQRLTDWGFHRELPLRAVGLRAADDGPGV
jgi:hypothetical protein